MYTQIYIRSCLTSNLWGKVWLQLRIYVKDEQKGASEQNTEHKLKYNAGHLAQKCLCQLQNTRWASILQLTQTSKSKRPALYFNLRMPHVLRRNTSVVQTAIKVSIVRVASPLITEAHLIDIIIYKYINIKGQKSYLTSPGLLGRYYVRSSVCGFCCVSVEQKGDTPYV